MRKIWPALILCLLSSATTFAEHRALRRELTPFDSEKICSPDWDFSRLSTLDDCASAYVSFKAGAYFESAGQRCRSYALLGDTLVYRGYNVGRHESMLLDDLAPARAVKATGDGVMNTSFCARGLLYGEYHTRETGTLKTSYCSRGRMLLYGDTIPAVLHSEIITTKKTVGGDSCETDGQTVIYRWLADGMFLPLALQIEEQGMPPRLYVAEEAVTDELALPSVSRGDPADDDIVMSVLKSAYGRRTSEGIEVGFGATSGTPFMTDVYLIDSSGNIYTSATIYSGDTCSVPLPPVYAGTLFVVVSANGRPQLNHKFIVGA